MKRELYVKYRNERTVCGRLAIRIVWVIFLKETRTRETLSTEPKPALHLLCHHVNIMLEGGSEWEAGLHFFNVDLHVFPVLA